MTAPGTEEDKKKLVAGMKDTKQFDAPMKQSHVPLMVREVPMHSELHVSTCMSFYSNDHRGDSSLGNDGMAPPCGRY